MASGAVLHISPDFSPEDAAHAAADYVASLDNLPGEVTFLLEEIADKDQRINNLLTRINTRHYGLTKNARNQTAQSSPLGSTPAFPLPIAPGQPLPIDHLSTKDQQAMQKIQAEWIKVDILQQEKVRLAQRLERIVSRARERGKAEWKRVGGMDLDEMERDGGRAGLGEMGGGQVLLPTGGLGSGSDGRPHKKRKPTAALPLPTPVTLPTPTIIHPPQPMAPPSLPSRHSHAARTNHSRHGRHISTSTLSEDPEVDPEADVEMDVADNGDGDADDTLYCFCQQKSYGEMIGCDNDKCEFEWFHVKCVNISGELPETWYCPSCVAKLGLSSSDGTRPGGRDKKGRKR